MIYLSTPYWHPDPQVRQKRFEIVSEIASYLIYFTKHALFSPISHGHAIFKDRDDLDPGIEYWEKYEKQIMPICSELIVVCIEGWKESRGVKREIDLAKELGIPIRFWEPMGKLEKTEIN